MRDASMSTDYDAIADWYDQTLRAGSLLHDHILATLPDLLGPIAGQRVCDLACGQGIVARVLAERGALVTGIDLSERLLALVRAEETREPRGIHYQQGDAQHLPMIADATSDGLVCCMALMDIPDLAATAATMSTRATGHQRGPLFRHVVAQRCSSAQPRSSHVTRSSRPRHSVRSPSWTRSGR
ncbi:MAG: methyltransferase domain-containing protein [Chloroflexi bacterium]|nr:methyltransferase domain-containing protein [Chloroflexota bacterium]